MFGISPLGWLHTLGSVPAIPAAAYMLIRHGRIVPRSTAGAVYFGSMLLGAATVFIVAHQPASYGIGAATLVFLLAGYGASLRAEPGRVATYLETVCLSVTVFLLMLPTVSEILRRVPDGHPLVTDLKSPLLLGAQGGVFLLFVAGLSAQIVRLRRQGRVVATAGR